MSGNPVSQTEFHAFRIEMRDYMKQQTQLMSQMVELQTKHSNLESQFIRLDRTVDELESRFAHSNKAKVVPMRKPNITVILFGLS